MPDWGDVEFEVMLAPPPQPMRKTANNESARALNHFLECMDMLPFVEHPPEAQGARPTRASKPEGAEEVVDGKRPVFSGCEASREGMHNNALTGRGAMLRFEA